MTEWWEEHIPGSDSEETGMSLAKSKPKGKKPHRGKTAKHLADKAKADERRRQRGF